MNTIKKISIVSVLIAGIGLLSACGKENKNPLLDPHFTKGYAAVLQGFFSGKADHICPFYFSDTDKYADQKSVCEKWLSGAKRPIQNDLDHYNKKHHKPVVTLTNDDYRDPDFWQKVTLGMREPSSEQLRG